MILWEDDDTDSFYCSGAVMQMLNRHIRVTVPYSCQGRVMTELEATEWEKGKLLESGEGSVVYSFEPRDITKKESR